MPDTFSVSELLLSIDAALQVCFPDEVWVEGEISALKSMPLNAGDARGPRHIFFNLIDPETAGLPGSGRPVLPVKLFDSQRTRVNAYLRRYDAAGIKMTDGVRVRISGRLQFYPARSQVELRMNLLDPAYTLAFLATERDRVLRVLASEGLLERNQGLPIAPVPLSVGVVTSAGSAAAADFLHELELSGYGWRVVLAHSRVQGAGAERSLVGALSTLSGRGVDLIAIVRGGGAKTELATFDAETVGRAIATCPVPVITGIGHEIDDSVADRVAHTSYKTPTAVAASLVRRVEAFLDDAESGWSAVRRASAAACSRSGQQIERAAGAVEGRARLHTAHIRSALSSDQARLVTSTRRAIGTRSETLGHVEARVRSLDPARALARGWTITRSDDGRTIRSAGDVEPGARMVTVFHDGEVPSVAEERA